MLAPRSCSKFLSFITGWVTLIGWQATTASSAYLAGTILQSTILMLDINYAPKPYQAMLLGWAVLAFAVTINTVGSKTLAHFEGLILILHVLGFFAILIPLVYLSDHNDTSIFTTFVNSGGWYDIILLPLETNVLTSFVTHTGPLKHFRLWSVYHLQYSLLLVRSLLIVIRH